jgi:hypothetical protein
MHHDNSNVEWSTAGIALIPNESQLERRAIDSSWTPASCLTQLCEQELKHRLQQRHKRYLKEAKLPAGRALAPCSLNHLEVLTLRLYVTLVINMTGLSKAIIYCYLAPVG